jgi:quercetin dioxygenase-like cupin family protein
MTEDEFQAKLKAGGYGDVSSKQWEPETDGEFHSHEFSAMLLVTEGEFRVVYEGGTEAFGPGESCEVTAGTVHYEQTGPAGAVVLAGKK